MHILQLIYIYFIFIGSSCFSVLRSCTMNTIFSHSLIRGNVLTAESSAFYDYHSNTQ